MSAKLPIVIDLNQDRLSEPTEVLSMVSSGLEDLRVRIKLLRKSLVAGNFQDDWSPGSFPYDQNWICHEATKRSIGTQSDAEPVTVRMTRDPSGIKLSLILRENAI